MSMWDFLNAHVPSQSCVGIIILGIFFLYKMPNTTLDIAKEILLEFKELFTNGLTSKGINALGGVLVFIFIVGVMISDPLEKIIGLIGNDHEPPDFPHKEILFLLCILFLSVYFIICIFVTKNESK